MKHQLSSIKPDIEKICENVRQCHLLNFCLSVFKYSYFFH